MPRLATLSVVIFTLLLVSCSDCDKESSGTNLGGGTTNNKPTVSSLADAYKKERASIQKIEEVAVTTAGTFTIPCQEVQLTSFTMTTPSKEAQREINRELPAMKAEVAKNLKACGDDITVGIKVSEGEDNLSFSFSWLGDSAVYKGLMRGNKFVAFGKGDGSMPGIPENSVSGGVLYTGSFADKNTLNSLSIVAVTEMRGQDEDGKQQELQLQMGFSWQRKSATADSDIAVQSTD